MMKALSLSQPYAWTIFDPIADKGLENRDWPPPIEMIGQTIAIHAAKSFDETALPMIWGFGIKTPDMYTKSAIVGVATIDRVVTEVKTLTAAQRRWFFVERPEGKTNYGWLLADRRKLTKPITWDGQLGLWTVPPIVENEIASQLSGNPPDNGYRIPMLAALTAAGMPDVATWVAKRPGDHLWFVYQNIPSCAACGKVQPRDTKKNPGKPCKGIVRITLRTADA